MLSCAAAAQTPSLRLPDQVVPLSEDVELTLDPRLDTFRGSVAIEIDVRERTRTLWLNAKDLSITNVAVRSGGSPVTVSRTLTARGEFLGIELANEIFGRATIAIEYRAALNDKAQSGVYRRNVEGNWYVFTTFTPIEARRAFPCFDEPRFKIPWRLTLNVPAGDRAFANTAQLDDSHFAETKPLPSELVAFAVGPFDVFEGSRVRVITPKGRAAFGRSASEATDAVLPRLEALTGIPYVFGKLDYVALPDGLFSAVENPGLITYVAGDLLIPPGKESPARTHDVRALEAHELAHQWFGNLVTQADWQDVWLSEGVATWVERAMMDQEEPAHRIHLDAIRARERVIRIDKQRPVRQVPESFDDIRASYHRIVYDKGGSILLMLEGWLGEDKFREGLRRYIQAHLYGVATTADLTSALWESSRIDTSRVVHALADATGVPEVSTEIECGSTAKLHVQVKGPSPIPVCWRTASESSCSDGAKDIELTSCPTWVYPNAGGTGYYRTTWTEAQLKALPLESLSAAERLTLAYDLRAQKAGKTVLDKLAKDPEPESRTSREFVQITSLSTNSHLAA